MVFGGQSLAVFGCHTATMQDSIGLQLPDTEAQRVFTAEEERGKTDLLCNTTASTAWAGP